MSDPVTNVDIEDVLASIRRLVADTGPEPLRPPVAERLVLTPALRVAHPAPGAAVAVPVPAVPAVADVIAPEPVPADLAPPDAGDAANADSAPRVTTGHAAPDAAPAVLTLYQPLPPDPGPVDAGGLAQARATEPALPDTPVAPDHPSAVAEDSAQRLARTIAELEAALGVGTGEWEPDGSEAGGDAVASQAPVVESAAAAQATPEPVPEATFVHAAPPPAAAAPPIFHSQRAAPATPAAQMADLLDEDLADDDWPATLSATGTAVLQEDSVIDEETLRRLVIEIVREELQGTLGERITRNVRKLVRREIYRVLSSEEFS